MKYLFLILSLFTLSVSAQTVLPNPSTVTAATMNAVLTGHITSSTAANDYTGLLTGWTSYPGAFDIRFTNHNTGSATFNLNSIGAKTLKKYSSGSLVDLVSGDISDGEVIRFQYDGTYLIKMGGGSVDIPGSDTQIIRNVSGALGASSALYYDATNNIFNASSNLTKVGSGSRSNNFYLGIDHTDSVASSTLNGWNFLQGEHETVSNNGSSGSVINNSFFYGGYRNAIRVKSGSASTIYNSGIIGGQDNYISASNSFLGSSVIIGGIKNRITATGVTRKGLAIIGGEKNIVTGNHSVAIGGYSQSVTDSATVAVPNLNITTMPVTADTTTFVLGRRNSDGKVIKIHASALGGGGGGSSSSRLTANTQTASYTLVLSDTGKVIRMNVTSTANNLTVPTNASVAFPIGSVINAEQVGTGITTVVASGGVTITQPAGGTLIAPGQGVPFVLYKTGTNTWELWNGGPNGWLTSGTTTLLGNTAHAGSFTNTAATDSELIVQNNLSGTGKPALKITPGFHTSLTASTEFPNLTIENSTQTWAAGTIGTQRFNYIKSPTADFASTSTITNAYNLYIDPVLVGSHATITNNYALGVNGKSNFTNTLIGTVIGASTLLGSDAWGSFSGSAMTFNVNQLTTPSLTFNTISSYQSTSGDWDLIEILQNTSVTSGTANFNHFKIKGTVSGTSNSGQWTGISIVPTYTSWGGNIIAYDYHPTVTSITGYHLAARYLSGNILIGDAVTAVTPTASTRVDQVGLGTTSSTINHRWANSSNTQIAALTDDGALSLTSKVTFPSTIITAGTTGAQTINKPSGQVNFAAAASTLVVTNSLATASSIVIVQVLGADTTAKTATVTKSSGSFTITLNAAATAETAVEFIVFN